MIDEKIEQTIYRLLHPNDTLDVRLFDARKQMHPDVRKILLDNSRYILAKTLGKIPGLEVDDIWLVGSSASYFYHEKSDLDVRIVLRNDNCEWLTKDEDALRQFLYSSFMGILQSFRFNLYDRFVDVKLDCQHKDKRIYTGPYSILNDKWINTPDKNLFADLTFDGVLAAYQNKYRELTEYMENIQVSGALQTRTGLKELETLYVDMIKNCTSDPLTYIVFKLLVYTKVFSEMQNLYSTNMKNYLDIK